MRKVVSSLLLLACMSLDAVAMDLRIDNPYIYKVALSKEAQSKINALKNQNQSLRETIHAQSKSLISSSDAVERLSSENAILKRKLQKMEGCINASQALSLQGDFDKLQKENEELRDTLYELRKSTMAERIKIQKYEEDAARGLGLERAYASEACEGNENISRKISLYKSNISYLEAGIELKNKEIDLLKLENQELSTRMKLVCGD